MCVYRTKSPLKGAAPPKQPSTPSLSFVKETHADEGNPTIGRLRLRPQARWTAEILRIDGGSFFRGDMDER